MEYFLNPFDLFNISGKKVGRKCLERGDKFWANYLPMTFKRTSQIWYNISRASLGVEQRSCKATTEEQCCPRRKAFSAVSFF